MTINELIRAINSKKRQQKNEAQEKATMDYILADLIGQSISRLFSSNAAMPDISDIYPSLFDNQQLKEAKQAKRDELSVLRFKQFAEIHNKKFQEVASSK